MKRSIFYFAAIGLLFFASCHRTPEERLQRAMMPLAKAYLDTCKVSYDSVRVDCVDTITELSYANLNIELLTNMEANYEMQYEEALVEDTAKAKYLRLYLGDIRRTIDDFQDLMETGDLKNTGGLLYMVTGVLSKGEEKENFMFLVRPDKKTLHTLDPFGNNLLYEEE
ncbi:MAG: hypothetical protein J6S56_03890 [Bacteroidales bacterium]|nr:hypothetical protein [Bacteroidales bacterium]